jgi:HlyD family secretion protein
VSKVTNNKAVIIGLALILGAGCARRQQSDNNRKPVGAPVAVAEVRTGDIQETLEVTGNIQAAHDVSISSKIMGKVAQVHVKEGQSIREGQVLVSLEDRELRAQLRQAEAGLEAARARLAQSHSGLGIQAEASSAGVVQAETALAAAKSRLAQSEQAYKLQKEQSASNVEQAEAGLEAAKVRLAQAEANKSLTSETVETQLQSALAQLATAQANLDKVRTGAREQERTEADAAVAQAQSALDNARANLDRAKNLFASGATSKQQLDAAQLQYDVSKSNHDMAVERRNLVYEGARPEDLKMAEIQVEQAKTGVAAAEANRRQNDLRQRELEAAQAGVR